MVVDLNFHKVIKYFLSIFFFLLFSSKSFSENFTFKKLTDLNDPWGSSFINNEELIITEKTGKIKIINIISREVYEVEHNLNYFVHGCFLSRSFFAYSWRLFWSGWSFFLRSGFYFFFNCYRSLFRC